MKLLIADDEPLNRKVLQAIFAAEGYDVIEAENGPTALQLLEDATGPMVALIDWEMPGIPGVEVCARARRYCLEHPLFLILVTIRDSAPDKIAGLGSGAHDYVVKPFNTHELIARVRIARQMVELQTALKDRVVELENALSQVKQLSGLLPICSYCKQIRDDHNYWHQVESYIGAHSSVRFSHGCCPSCFEIHLRPQVERVSRPKPAAARV